MGALQLASRSQSSSLYPQVNPARQQSPQSLDPSSIRHRKRSLSAHLSRKQATQNDLILLPVGRSHTQTGKPLFKITRSIDGKGGLTVYIGDNAVFAQMEDGTYRAVSLDEWSAGTVVAGPTRLQLPRLSHSVHASTNALLPYSIARTAQ